MLLANLPAWFAKRFGADATGAYIRAIPATTADPDAASMALGFPPNTFVDEGAGGSPPDGRDFNGILNFLSAWAQWQGAGGPIPWNSTIAALGYPKGAIVQGTTDGVMYRNTTDGNTTNPNAAGAGWIFMETILAELLTANMGYRSMGSGFKQCWGRVNVPGASQVTVTMPITHTGYINPALAGQLDLTTGLPLKIGVTPVDLNSFVITNNETTSRAVYWQTVGN